MFPSRNFDAASFEAEAPKKPVGILKKTVLFLGFRGMLVAFVLLIAAIFCLQNIESTSVQFLGWKILEVPKLYLVAISMLLGAMIGVLLGWRFRYMGGSRLHG